jgi:V8-like Glu-specific endopeptidase
VVREQHDPDWFSVVVEAGLDGLEHPYGSKRIEAERLTSRRLGKHAKVRHLDGYVPPGSDLSFIPKKAHRPRADRQYTESRDRARGGTIFGNDDRYLFNDRSFPWRTTGLIRMAGGRCSGTTIGPRLVLTASHCINWGRGGSSSAGWVTFTPGYFDGSGPWGEISANRVIYWNQAPSVLTDQETAFDYVVLVMNERIGERIGYPGFRTYHNSWNRGSFWQYIGYPGELSSGERPAFQGDGVISSAQNEGMSGQTGKVLGHFNEFTPGQSGGAAWGWWGSEPWPRVVGVGSTIGSTAVQVPTGSTVGDNEYGGGPALSSLISWARANYP